MTSEIVSVTIDEGLSDALGKEMLKSQEEDA